LFIELWALGAQLLLWQILCVAQYATYRFRHLAPAASSMLVMEAMTMLFVLAATAWTLRQKGWL
jgi:hypothetical protein